MIVACPALLAAGCGDLEPTSDPTSATPDTTRRDTSAYSSRLAAAWGAEPADVPWRMIDGSVILADLSGFTRLSETLTSTGAEGVEVLHRVLTHTFEHCSAKALPLAVTCSASQATPRSCGSTETTTSLRAVEAAAAMPVGLAGLPTSSTGRARLRVSVGVHTGPCLAVLVGTTQRRLFVCGPGISTVAALEARRGRWSGAGEPGRGRCGAPFVVAAPSPGRVWHSDDVGEPRFRSLVRCRPPSASGGQRYSAMHDSARHLISPAVWDVLQADGANSDHRAASIGFVGVSGLDAILATDGPSGVHAVLHTVATTVTAVTTEMGVTWLDVDAGVDSVKLMLTGGAPLAVDDDEDRLLLALRRIVDECPVPLRAGAQRGKVFAGAARRRRPPHVHRDRRSRERRGAGARRWPTLVTWWSPTGWTSRHDLTSMRRPSAPSH